MHLGIGIQAPVGQDGEPVIQVRGLAQGREHHAAGGDTGGASRKLLHVSRLRRDRASYLERYGPAAYDMMLGDCLWHVYAMSGKLDRRVYLLSADEPGR